jgi:succinate dehydrogenase/fumarate reductase-like Fe-S protein
MKLTLKIWRQKNARAKGTFVTYKMDDVSPEMAFLEMLDALNKRRLPRRDMRVMRNVYKWSSSRTNTGDYHMPSLNEVL